jgi:uncharacterized protein (DUF1501 family)
MPYRSIKLKDLLWLTSLMNRLLQNVFSFTASDFGRTLTSNGDGTDHGWGSHHFTFGGPTTTSKFIGTAPTLANNGVDDVGQGRLIPTTGMDQLAMAMGTWLGVFMRSNCESDSS